MAKPKKRPDGMPDWIKNLSREERKPLADLERIFVHAARRRRAEEQKTKGLVPVEDDRQPVQKDVTPEISSVSAVASAERARPRGSWGLQDQESSPARVEGSLKQQTVTVKLPNPLAARLLSAWLDSDEPEFDEFAQRVFEGYLASIGR
jgi:hypothetical protein